MCSSNIRPHLRQRHKQATGKRIDIHASYTPQRLDKTSPTSRLGCDYESTGRHPPLGILGFSVSLGNSTQENRALSRAAFCRKQTKIFLLIIYILHALVAQLSVLATQNATLQPPTSVQRQPCICAPFYIYSHSLYGSAHWW